MLGREFTGYGFFTDFEILDKGLKLAGSPSLTLGKVQARLDGLKYGVGIAGAQAFAPASMLQFVIVDLFEPT